MSKKNVMRTLTRYYIPYQKCKHSTTSTSSCSRKWSARQVRNAAHTEYNMELRPVLEAVRNDTRAAFEQARETEDAWPAVEREMTEAYKVRSPLLMPAFYASCIANAATARNEPRPRRKRGAGKCLRGGAPCAGGRCRAYRRTYPTHTGYGVCAPVPRAPHPLPQTRPAA